jgi:hypothetical protein
MTFGRFWRRLRAEAAEAWRDSNRASALMREHQEAWRTNTTLHWVNTRHGPRLMGSRLPTSRPQT